MSETFELFQANMASIKISTEELTWGDMALEEEKKNPYTPQNTEKGWTEVPPQKKIKKTQSKTTIPAEVQGAKKKLDFGNAPAAAGAGKNSAAIKTANSFSILAEDTDEDK